VQNQACVAKIPSANKESACMLCLKDHPQRRRVEEFNQTKTVLYARNVHVCITIPLPKTNLQRDARIRNTGVKSTTKKSLFRSGLLSQRSGGRRAACCSWSISRSWPVTRGSDNVSPNASEFGMKISKHKMARVCSVLGKCMIGICSYVQ
jgi:hypothetical protein